MKIFILMLQFLTRIPINRTIDIKDGDFAKGVVYFPIIGLIIGIANSLIYYISSLFLEPFISVICVLLANTLITGALHLDGLADTCDGLFSARKRERMLEIMRDSRIGTNGFLGLFFILTLKFAFLYSLVETFIIPAILLTPVVGRTVMSAVMHNARYAREGQGLGDLFIGRTGLLRTLSTIAVSVVIAFFLFSYVGVVTLLSSLVIGYYFRNFFHKKLGGLTGDLLGAINEICEITAIPLLIVLQKQLGGF